ncbi:Pectate lyase [Musa troglodytarum]|uniref:Pectate lyase n=1 Tax=Musa troglodytarum TaxID=320322 RepID=A0A9E7IHE4_9LILI|nr:Pectate lyase [Musa troglodytarum]
MECSPRFFFFPLLFMAAAAFCNAHIAEFDEYWQKKEAMARAKVQNAYNPNPESVTKHFNDAVLRDLEKNNTRRGLRGKRQDGGPCMATNPIDRCWRCQKNWAHHRKRLATCAKGFGRHVTGGKNGDFYVVTDPSDDDLVNPRKGTLRYGVIQDRPLWIVFARDMVIRLSEELIVNSNKTIDGRGADVQITNGAGITIQYVDNVIIHNLRIHDIKAGSGGMIRDSEHHYGLRTRSDGDGISIFGASNVWIDHVSMSNCMDGLIDAIEGSTAITISNGHFTQHNDVMLFGASDSFSGDAVMQITVAFNHFGKGLVQRMPRCRWGFVHVVNNDYTHWMMYAIGGSQHPTILSQGNRFIAPPTLFAKEVTKREYSPEEVWKNWHWKSEGDLLQNGAFFVPSGAGKFGSVSYKDLIRAKPGTFVTRLTRFTGALKCVPNRPC